MSIKQTVKKYLPLGFVEAVSYARKRELMRKRMNTPSGCIPDEIKLLFEQKTGEDLDFKNPQTYNQKIQCFKAYCRERLYGELADKYLVRSFVDDRIGSQYLTDLYGVWDSVSDINYDLLPNSFVIKATHGCGWNIVVPDKREFDTRLSNRRLSRWLKLNYAFVSDYEMHYQYCVPRVIAEEYLSNGVLSTGTGEDLWDYKFWCFDGKCQYIQFLSNRSIGLDMAFFDTDWVRQPFVYSHKRNERPVKKPDNLDKMIEIAEKLAKGFPHVRVDLYRMNDSRIVFGELTFTSMDGYCKWDPTEADALFGDLYHLPDQWTSR